jgi:hydroxymethylpyrimidine kinase/phosphomethylpyrimidine kinase
MNYKADNTAELAENKQAIDYLWKDKELHIWKTEYVETDSTHGTGCTLSAAIAANLALGKSLNEAMEISKKFVTEAIRTSPNIGKGHSPVNHLLDVLKLSY